jgi:hypothetical protein
MLGGNFGVGNNTHSGAALLVAVVLAPPLFLTFSTHIHASASSVATKQVNIGQLSAPVSELSDQRSAMHSMNYEHYRNNDEVVVEWMNE